MITEHAAPAARTPALGDYEPIIGPAELSSLRAFARPLGRRRAKMINSQAVGGSVAEVLNRLVPLLSELGVETRWEVLTGGEDFLAVTKAFHSALQGGAFEPHADWFDLFLAVNDENRKRLIFDDDFVVVHDPQPLPLVEARAMLRAHWIWRCNLDLSHPNPDVWSFLGPFVERYDAAIFSSPSFTQKLAIPEYLMYPTIDPLADKNRELEPGFVTSVVEKFGIDPDRPIVTQISRFDRLKDPVGVIQAYRIVRRFADCQLVLAGGGPSEQGESVLRDVREAASQDPDIHVLNLPPWSHLEINALQRASTVIVQKSIREGFGLTVTEALWKGRPVVAAAVGGLPSQIIHKVTGLLVHSVEGTAYQIRYLLANPDLARRLGENGHQHVRENFLITHNLKRYLLLFLALDGQGSCQPS